MFVRVSDEKSARTYLNTIATRLKDDVDTLKGNFNMLNRVRLWCCMFGAFILLF